jgi:hypothetical protein
MDCSYDCSLNYNLNYDKTVLIIKECTYYYCSYKYHYYLVSDVGIV